MVKRSTELVTSCFRLEGYIASADEPSPKRIAMDSHVHDRCEIYINLSGDVSFMVEGRLYPIERGDVIVTRPYEYHHCILHGETRHDHICIWFSPKENETLLEPFFSRNIGEKNLISLTANEKERLLLLAHSFIENESILKKHVAFFSILELLSETEVAHPTVDLPDDVRRTMSYVEQNLAEPLTVESLAARALVTVNTLERHFKTHLGLSPYAYLQSCRLTHAASLLEGGRSVTDAAEESGFSDYSHFIALFKKRYGITPYQWKKESLGARRKRGK